MKKLVFCAFILLIFTACSSQESSDVGLKIHYNAFTRGSSIDITIAQSSIVYKDVNGEKAIVKKELFWQKLDNYIENIELKNIASFIPLSNDRVSDKALHATLIIYKGGVAYSSKTFDHGNPPKELKALLDFLFKELQLQ